MPKGSPELTQARREEIVNACQKLYEVRGFQDTTIKDIGAETSFTRTSIYNYFQTREEIFIALFKREYDCWIEDLEKVRDANEAMTAADFADALGLSLEKRIILLRLLAGGLDELEKHTRIERLIELKCSYRRCVETLRGCLGKFFPELTEEKREGIVFSLLPYLGGLYNHTHATEKQMAAMTAAGMPYVPRTVRGMVRTLMETLLT